MPIILGLFDLFPSFSFIEIRTSILDFQTQANDFSSQADEYVLNISILVIIKR
tara:strand:+ start:670 stop:828 length:159 start_codon:yes stop_codon:yes gene_type:complete